MPNLPSLHFHTNSISGSCSKGCVFGSPEMAQAQERPRITEIQVRIDCNGCVQKIKKALQGINGISDVYIDLPRQKLTIVGWANPERIIKAIKKARKNATIYSCSEVQEPQPAEATDPATPDNEAPPPPDDGNPAAEQSQPEPPKDQPTPPLPPSEPPQVPENPTHERPPPPPPPPENRTTHEPSNPPVNPNETQRHQHKDGVDEVHVIHHHPPDSGYGPRFGPGYNRGPPGYSHGYGPDYSPEQPRYSQSYHLGYNSGPPQAYDHGHSHIPPEYRRGYSNDYSPEPPHYSPRDGPSYNPGPPGYSEGYGSSYGSRSSGYSQGYESGYNPGPHSQSHGNGGSDWSDRPEPSYRPERPQPVQVTHSYSQYRPPSYVTQYEYVQSPPRQMPHSRTENYYYYNNGDYQNDYNNNNNGYVPSIFSEENPNACTIS